MEQIQSTKLSIEVNKSEAYLFIRKFTGFFRITRERSEEETIRILQEVYPEDNKFTAKASLEDMVGRKVMYTASRFFVLDRVHCANSNYNYRICLANLLIF